MGEFLLGLILGALITYVVVRNQDSVADAIVHARENAPDAEQIREAAPKVGRFLKKYGVFFLIGFVVLCVLLGTWLQPDPLPRVRVGEATTVEDACGVKTNVVMSNEIVMLGRITVGEGECQRTVPLITNQ